MLSILIPVYNYDIRLLLKHIYTQAFKEKINFEILIADDASSNVEIKKKNQLYQKLNHCKVFNFSKNKGRTYTRNFLAEKASFNHLLFLDADVLPKKSTFIKDFISYKSQADLIFGGIEYTKEKPENDKILRWKYGKEREGKTVEERKENPYFTIISQAFFIKKNVFLKTNQFLENQYGLDSVFTSNLKKNKVKVLHINNPIIHFGLESAQKFIDKTQKGLITLVHLEKENLVSANYRPIQKAYRQLKTFYSLNLFVKFYHLFQLKIEKNLLSENPSLFYFDLYKLNYYISLKKKQP